MSIKLAGGDNYQDVVFELIKWFQAQGRLNELLEAAKRANPRNSKLEKFEPRPDVGQSAYNLVQRARAEARKPNGLEPNFSRIVTNS